MDYGEGHVDSTPGEDLEKNDRREVDKANIRIQLENMQEALHSQLRKKNSEKSVQELKRLIGEKQAELDKLG